MRAHPQHNEGQTAYCIIFAVLALIMAVISISGLGGDATPMAGLIALVCVGLAIGARRPSEESEKPKSRLVPPACKLKDRPAPEDRQLRLP